MGIQLVASKAEKPDQKIAYSFSFLKDSESETPYVKGQFSQPLDLLVATSFLPALGEVIVDLERQIVEVVIQRNKALVNASLYESGMFTLTGPVTEEIVDQFAQVIQRGLLCTACGTCQSICPENAISLETGTARINEVLCSQCGACLRGKCPSLFVL
jgi:ferredoxin